MEYIVNIHTFLRLRREDVPNACLRGEPWDTLPCGIEAVYDLVQGLDRARDVCGAEVGRRVGGESVWEEGES